MTAERNGPNIALVEGGHVVALATLESTDDPTVLRASLHTEAGHHPVGAGARLVDALLDLGEATRWRSLEATLHLGDFEVLERLRTRCPEIHARPAGATCLVDAKLPDPH